MTEDSLQTQAWSSEFGREYTIRNFRMTVDELDNLYRDQMYSFSRTEMNAQFLSNLDKDIRILEVGCNVGLQLSCLRDAGFQNLYGIDLSEFAVDLSKHRTKWLNIIQGSALDIPFKDGFFDLVFTSGVLIHIPPWELDTALSEMYRCSSKYIWGLEYFAPEYTPIPYRESKETPNMLWKADFPKLLCQQFFDLEEVKVRHFKYLDNDNVDIMYLLRKRGQG